MSFDGPAPIRVAPMTRALLFVVESSRKNTTDSLVTGNEIFDTGNRREKFGEGVYIGSSDANWGALTGGHGSRGGFTRP